MRKKKTSIFKHAVLVNGRKTGITLEIWKAPRSQAMARLKESPTNVKGRLRALSAFVAGHVLFCSPYQATGPI